jgi:hypothetical protein
MGGERVAVDGAIAHHGGDHAGIAQPGDERRRFPVSMGDADPQALPLVPHHHDADAGPS